MHSTKIEEIIFNLALPPGHDQSSNSNRIQFGQVNFSKNLKNKFTETADNYREVSDDSDKHDRDG